MVSQMRLGVLPVIGLGLALSFVGSAMGFNMAANTNLAVYWGQNSYGATNPSDTAGWQKTISYYCGSGIDTIPIGFLTSFVSTGNMPTIDLANICNTSKDPVFPGTSLLDCSFLAADIQSCQASGTAVTLSIGGASGSVSFSSDSQGAAYAQVIWDLFLGGSSNTRPFGSAVLDGIDMDIEGGSQTGYAAFLNALRSLMNGGSKRYYITAAPQCPYPDAYIGSTLNAVAFDAVYVQFYNNYCDLTYYSNPTDWDFGSWDNWARTVSPNPNVKLYIGAPGAPAAAGSGYVSPSTITTILQQTQSQYSTFGGAMLWDASQAYNNGRYDLAVKSALTSGPGAGSPPPTTTSTATTTTAAATTTTTTTTPAPTTTTTTSSAPPTTTTSSSGTCSTVSAWQSNVAYVAGNQVTYNGYLWTALSWNYNEVPGGASGAWSNNGAC